MFITTHAAIGALLAEAVPNHPVAAFCLGVASHFLSDIIPHGDSHLYKGFVSGTKVRRALAYVTIDGVIALFFSLFLLNTKLVDNQLATTWGIVGGVLPDLMVGVYEVTRFRALRLFHRFHFFFHNMISAKHGDLSFPAGFSMQLIFLAALITRLV
jgi:hypothetical protein